MKRFLLLTGLLTATVVSCSQEAPPPVDGGRLVVEGWIDSGGAPVVLVTTPVAAREQEQRVAGLVSHIVAWADVRVIDEQGTEVQLTGRPDDRYIPPYIYTTDHLRGVPGRAYELRIRSGNRFVRGYTRIPAPASLESLTVTPSFHSDTLMAVTAHFTPPPEGTYYRFFTRVEGKDSTWCPSTLSGTTIAGNSVSILRGWSARSLTWHQPLFRPGETVHVKYCTVEEPVYRFWNSFDEMVNLTSQPVVTSTHSLASTLEGAYGYWAGYGVSTGEVTIDP